MTQLLFKRLISLILLSTPLLGCEKTIWSPEPLITSREGDYHYVGTLHEKEDSVVVHAQESDEFTLNFQQGKEGRYWVYLSFHYGNSLLKKMNIVDNQQIEDPITFERIGTIYYDQFGHQIVLYTIDKNHFAPNDNVTGWFAIKDFPYEGRNVFYHYK
jgi:hypothetical protein